MKQRKVVSMIGALVVIISAVVLITGCSQPNSNKGNTGNNSGNIGNNGGNTGNNSGSAGNNGGNTGNNAGNIGGNTGSPLDEVIMVTGSADNDIRTYYFSRGVVYYVMCYSSGLVKKSRTGSYSGNSITTSSLGTATCTVNPDEVILFFGERSRAFPRITESQNLYKTIKNAPVNN